MCSSFVYVVQSVVYLNRLTSQYSISFITKVVDTVWIILSVYYIFLPPFYIIAAVFDSKS